MAIFQLEIADADVQRVFDAICSNYGRSSSVEIQTIARSWMQMGTQ